MSSDWLSASALRKNGSARAAWRVPPKVELEPQPAQRLPAQGYVNPLPLASTVVGASTEI